MTRIRISRFFLKTVLRILVDKVYFHVPFYILLILESIGPPKNITFNVKYITITPCINSCLALPIPGYLFSLVVEVNHLGHL